MRQTWVEAPVPASRARRGERGQARTVALVAVCFGLGIAVSAFWFTLRTKGQVGGAPGPADALATPPLLPGTRAVLERLDAPVELRFYRVLDPATVPASELAFAERVDRLLSAYEQAGQGKIKLTRFQEPLQSGKGPADADGIQAFNLENGQACLLGLAVEARGRKESLPRLLSQWETALEPDVSRAIARVAEPRAPAGTPPVAVSPDGAVVEEVRRLIPKFDEVSLEDGTRVLRQAALNKFAAAANEFRDKVNEARQALSQAQQSNSEAEQQAAKARLQAAESEQFQALKDIAARSQAQIDVWNRLKAAAQQSVPR
jgi:hypothetical protein